MRGEVDSRENQDSRLENGAGALSPTGSVGGEGCELGSK